MSEPSWQDRLRRARERALAAGVEIRWDRLAVDEEERQATIEAAAHLDRPVDSQD